MLGLPIALTSMLFVFLVLVVLVSCKFLSSELKKFARKKGGVQNFKRT